MKEKPRMHCHAELEADLNYKDFLPDDTLLKWFRDRYSTSKHLLTLFSIAQGLEAKKIIEIGFGRSTFVLAKAAGENAGRLWTCDLRDFSYLLSSEERKVTTFIHDNSSVLYDTVSTEEGIELAFLDYFSDVNINSSFIEFEILKCVSLMKNNGVIAVHDSIVANYRIHVVLEKLKRNLGLFHNSSLEIMSLPFNYGLGLIKVLKNSAYSSVTDNHKKKEETC